MENAEKRTLKMVCIYLAPMVIFSLLILAKVFLDVKINEFKKFQVTSVANFKETYTTIQNGQMIKERIFNIAKENFRNAKKNNPYL